MRTRGECGWRRLCHAAAKGRRLPVALVLSNETKLGHEPEKSCPVPTSQRGPSFGRNTPHPSDQSPSLKYLVQPRVAVPEPTPVIRRGDSAGGAGQAWHRGTTVQPLKERK